MLLVYLHYLHRRKMETYRLEAALHGIQLGKHTARVSEDDARDILVDPLKDFPNDVDYLTPKEVHEHMRYASACIARGKVPLWTPERESAALGRDAVARRAAQNDVLWKSYAELSSKGIQVGLDLLKYMVSVDIARSRLYPSGLRYTDYANAEAKQGRKPKPVDLKAPPPAWYVTELAKSGELPKIVTDLQRLAVVGLKKHGRKS